MKARTYTNETVSLITYETSDEFLYLKISLDTHEESLVTTQAVEELYTDMILSGSNGMSRIDFLDQVNSLGASIDFEFAGGVLTITLQTRTQNAVKALNLLFLTLKKPNFSATELRRAKQTAVAALQDYKEEARNIASDDFRRTLYKPGDRRFFCGPDKLIQHINKVSTRDIKETHKKIVKSFWYITAAGSSKNLSLFKKSILKLKTDPIYIANRQMHATAKPKSALVLNSIPSKSNIEFSIGQVLPITIHHPDFHAFAFGLNVLGKWGGFAGRLMSTVREREGLTYSIYARIEALAGDELGYWRIMTFFTPQQAKQGLASTVREVKKIVSTGVTKDEFNRFKQILTTIEILDGDSSKRKVNNTHGLHSFGFTLSEIAEHKKGMQEVSQKEVNQALKKYMDPNSLVISGAGPVNKVKKELKTVLV